MASWRKSRFLGSGSYGTVFLASPVEVNGSLDTASAVAVKSADLDVGSAYTSLKEEAYFLAQFNGHPAIIQCFGEDMSMEKGRMVYNLLLEYAPGGNLLDFIKKTYGGGGGIPETHVACYTSMLLRGLVAIHSKGIVHCDLKPANILVFTAPSGGIAQLKIADFGLASRVLEEEEEVHIYYGSHKYHNRGTPLYSSPESVAYGSHGTCTDIWSLGCIIFEMMTGKHIWDLECMNNLTDLFEQILHGPRRELLIPPYFSRDGIDFVNKCLERDPRRRRSAMELLQHPFIVNNINGMQQQQHYFTPAVNPFDRSGKWVFKNDLFSQGITLSPRETQQQQSHHRPLMHNKSELILDGSLVADWLGVSSLTLSGSLVAN